MRILFVCDLNSIHAQKWITYFVERKHQVFIYSTTPFQETFLGVRVFSSKTQLPFSKNSAGRWTRMMFQFIPPLLWAGFIESYFVMQKTFLIRVQTKSHREALSALLPEIHPDIIHALRIPNEGFIAAQLKTNIPVAVSTWGNDLIYWARKIFLKNPTRMTLKRAELLLSDCHRDIRLGQENGYSSEKPFLVVPGAGGITPELLAIGKDSWRRRSDFFSKNFGLSAKPVFLSLRGFGSQDIDNIPLLKACKALLKRGFDFHLVVPGRKGGFRYHKLTQWVRQLELHEKVFLIDELSHSDALLALQGADFSVSVARNDGVPNSMLEAMTFGAIPLMSNIESIREWIEDGKNGYLFDPSDPESIADVMERALREETNYSNIRQMNYKLICERGDFLKNMARAEEILQRVSELKNAITG